MTTTIFGAKQTMTESYIGDQRVPVTKIKLYPMKVAQIKSVEKDGYSAMQVNFGHSFIREIDVIEGLESGATLTPLDYIKAGSLVSVQGLTKGKGTAGVMKRWNFRGGPRTHGQSDRARAPGSIGQGTTPGRVLKGRHMAGRMGTDIVTIGQSQIVAIDPATLTIWVRGPVPGTKNALITIKVLDGGVAPDLQFLASYHQTTTAEVQS